MKNFKPIDFETIKKIMRYTTVIIVCMHWLTTVCTANDIFAQDLLDKNISLNVNNISLREALNGIEKQGDFRFMYSPDVLPLSQKITFKADNKKISVILSELLKPYKVTFQQLENYILIKEKPKSTGALMDKTGGQITGKVTDAQTGEALPGANVQVKNTAQGTTTSPDGSYSINITDENAILVFSFIGYNSEEITIGNQTIINVALVPGTQSLSQVVVVGYGEQQRKDVTSSIASIKGEKLTEVTAAGFDQALQGKIAGLQITSATGAPGGGVQVRIRGNSSVTGSNQPLYVIDGVPLYGNDAILSRNLSDAAAPNPEIPSVSILSTFNTNDIESIDVLKDASATAIYGARGANGVIMITTKRGKIGKPSLSLNVSTGIQQVNRYIPVTNALQYSQLVQEADFNGTGLPNPVANLSPDSLKRLVGNGTDWQREIFRTAPITQVNASIRGGSENTKYSISGGFFDQQGVVIKSFFNRYNLRANIDNQIGERFKIGISSAVTYQNTNMPQDNHFGERSMVLAAVSTTPLLPVYHPTLGSFAFGPTGIPGSWGGGFVNPVRLLNQEAYTTSVFRFTGNLNAEYKILPNLTVKAILGTDLVRNYQTTFRENFNLYRFITNELVPGPGVRWKEAYTNIRNLLNEETLTYDKLFGEDHRLTLLAGFTLQSFFDNYTAADARGATSNALRTFNYNQGTLRIEGNENKANLLSYFGRVQYAFRDKYLLTGTIRRDGSSRFGPDRRFAWFPSVSAGWR
ncbi:MAG: SusC/RagA family TonB-linked outer membrane protein, partial [Verrucomicrobia bacterium]|nr:SusC/RagA family TonB-linked outer membrane protein [Cytophagales bacterium]